MTLAMQSLFIEHHVAVDPPATPFDGREIGRTLLAALDSGKHHVVVDCREWLHLDLVLLSVLVRCADVFTSRGALLELANLSAEMRANIVELRLNRRLQLRD